MSSKIILSLLILRNALGQEEGTNNDFVRSVAVFVLFPTHDLGHQSQSHHFHETAKQQASTKSEGTTPLRSPEAENQLPSFQPDAASEQFLYFFDWNRRYNPNGHFMLLRNAVKLLKRSYSDERNLFALDHCSISK